MEDSSCDGGKGKNQPIPATIIIKIKILIARKTPPKWANPAPLTIRP
jgi:hypothetical protein